MSFTLMSGRQIGSMYSGKLYDIGGHQTGCLAAINRYTALRPTLRMSVASSAVAMSGP